MNRRLSVVATLLTTIVLFTPVLAAAPRAYLQLTGSYQGEIYGSVEEAGKEDTIAVLKLSHEVAAATDPTTGEATGKHQHMPVKVRKQLDRASPRLFQAMVTNEHLTEVEIRFYRSARDGTEEHFYTMRLTGARITAIQTNLSENQDAAPSLTEDVSFVYQNIEVIHETSGSVGRERLDVRR